MNVTLVNHNNCIVCHIKKGVSEEGNYCRQHNNIIIMHQNIQGFIIQLHQSLKSQIILQ